MSRILRPEIGYLLSEIAQALDISNTLFEDAEKKYCAVGSWLGEGDSPLAKFTPEIYPQGSFLLGTVIKPLSDEDEYDIDLVFRLLILKDQISQKELKNLVGDRLKASEVYKHMLDEEGKRCWTIKYAESAQFHMDILPAIPDELYSSILQKEGIPVNFASTSINITDKTLENYSSISNDWPRSNPKGFAAWFQSRMLIQYSELYKRVFGEAFKAEIEKVPNYRIKTPLQRCIQLLKRHRDINFMNDQDNKPASILITTLAANAYENEADIVDAMVNIIDRMPSFLVKRNGVAWVPNPIDPTENFADRWVDNPNRERNFGYWLQKVKSDFNRILTCYDSDSARKILTPIFGERVSNSAIAKLEVKSQSQAPFQNSVLQKTPPIVNITNPPKPWRA
jgi:hypothetical protein